MKSLNLVTAITTFSTLVHAKALLAVFGNDVAIGETYRIEWLADNVDTLQLLLVRGFPHGGGWTPERTLFDKVTGTPAGGNFTWVVDDSYPVGDNFAIWLESAHDDNTGYADLRGWFSIVGRKSEPELKM